jgi:HlyD family secretion protein
MTSVRRTGFLLFIVLAVAAAVYALSPKPVSADLSAVDRGSIEVTVDEEGVTRIREIYEVSAPLSGQIDRFPLDVGDPVKRDVSVVAEIRPVAPTLLDVRSRRELEAALDAAVAAVSLAEAELSRARAELRLAEADLARIAQLARSGTVSARTEEKAATDAEAARATVRRAEASLLLRQSERASAEARLMQPDGVQGETGGCCVLVRAPIDGVVLKVLAESAQVVERGARIAEIGDSGQMEVMVDLLSTDAVRVRPGTEARIEDWGGGQTLSARVSRIEPVAFTKVSALGVEEQRVNVRLDLLDPHAAWERLGHEFRVYVRIRVWRGDDVVRVPLAALFRRGAEWAVFRVVDGKARATVVSIDHRNTEFAEVLDGLSPGDTVILHPSDQIEDGVAVEARSDS